MNAEGMVRTLDAIEEMQRAHAWSKQGPKLLAALKKARDCLNEVHQDCYGAPFDRPWLDEAIRDAEKIGGK